MTFVSKIFEIISEIRVEKDVFFNNSNITSDDLNYRSQNVLFLGGTFTSWGQKTKEQTSSQLQLKSYFDNLKEWIKLSIPFIPKDELDDLLHSQQEIEYWINMEGRPPSLSPKSSIAAFDSELDKIESYFKLLEVPESDCVLFPDTNALISIPDPKDYMKFFSGKKISIIILPIVVSELDRHKLIHKSEEFRNKVSSVIRRIKGYRNQGDVLKGVNLEHGKVVLKMLASEPKYDAMPSWIDKGNNDDRIIASILDYQVKNMNSDCYLITRDINMLNKAELAGIKYYDFDV